MGFRYGEGEGLVCETCPEIVKRHLDRDMGHASQVFQDRQTSKCSSRPVVISLDWTGRSFRDHDSTVATGGLRMLPFRRPKWIPERKHGAEALCADKRSVSWRSYCAADGSPRPTAMPAITSC